MIMIMEFRVEIFQSLLPHTFTDSFSSGANRVVRREGPPNRNATLCFFPAAELILRNLFEFPRSTPPLHANYLQITQRARRSPDTLDAGCV